MIFLMNMLWHLKVTLFNNLILLDYFTNKMRFKKRKRISFRSIENQHVQYFNKIMGKQKTRNYNLE